MTKAKAEVAVIDKKETAVAVSNALPDFMMEDMGAGVGFEGAGQEAYAIPFIVVLQKMSPMVDEDDPKYVDGAKAGMLYNTVTRKLYDGKEGVVIIPCAYKQSYIRWGNREGGEGGFKGEFTPEEFAAMQRSEQVVTVDGKHYAPNEQGEINEKKSDFYSDTRSHYVILIDGDEVSTAIVSCSASQIKSSKMLMTSLQQKRVDTPKGKMVPPTFANMVKMSTVGQSNDKGTWSGLQFDLQSMVTDAALYREAQSFYKAVIGGEAKADYAKAENTAAAHEAASTDPKDAEGF